eukprot:TRINITY_DN423_c0_g1_i4.p7 TRINITY_DN423_c0_g1~~TRINITY_DN423_c0_g1_i4.p7  ORF type:complete len:133 (+),score=1.53 TRINITY_DN423_c0_g1_i4:1065-1463(+)
MLKQTSVCLLLHTNDLVEFYGMLKQTPVCLLLHTYDLVEFYGMLKQTPVCLLLHTYDLVEFYGMLKQTFVCLLLHTYNLVESQGLFCFDVCLFVKVRFLLLKKSPNFIQLLSIQFNSILFCSLLYLLSEQIN